MSHEHSDHCNCSSTTAAQSLDEMEFERGIWYAAFHNDTVKLKKFIAAGDANKLDSAGFYALHYAARNGNTEACNLLLQARADVDACTKRLHATPLIRAALMGHERILKMLINKGANIYHQDIDGNTAYHKAAQNNHENAMSILLGSCSDPKHLENIQNNKGQTAKDLLVEK